MLAPCYSVGQCFNASWNLVYEMFSLLLPVRLGCYKWVFRLFVLHNRTLSLITLLWSFTHSYILTLSSSDFHIISFNSGSISFHPQVSDMPSASLPHRIESLPHHLILHNIESFLFNWAFFVWDWLKGTRISEL